MLTTVTTSRSTTAIPTRLRALLPTGVIFDCDGTLVDSEPLAGRAWKATVAPYGYEVTDDDLAACMGGRTRRRTRTCPSAWPLPDAAAFWPSLRDELFSLIDTELALFADAVSAAA